MIRNLILVSKLYIIPKCQKGYSKKNIQFPLELEKTTYTLTSTLHLDGQTRYFTVLDRRTIQLFKNKMDSKFIKSHQCSLKRSHAVLTEINSEFLSRPRPFSTKTILTGLLVTKNYKNRTMKISLFSQSMLGYISPITTSLPHIFTRNSCPNDIFKPTHQTGL